MDKFVPKEPGWYWWQAIGGAPWVVVRVMRADTYYDHYLHDFLSFEEGELVADLGETTVPIEATLDNGTFHEGPIQPPEEGK